MPSQVTTYLGVRLDSTPRLVRPSPQRVSRILQVVRFTKAGTTVSSSVFSAPAPLGLSGRLPPTRPPAHATVPTGGSRPSLGHRLSDGPCPDVATQRQAVHTASLGYLCGPLSFTREGVPLGPVLTRRVFRTNASLTGWAPVCEAARQLVWAEHDPRYINLLELEAIRWLS